MGGLDTSTKFITLQTSKQERVGVFECAPDERLLYAGLRAGLPLPHECATGTCGSCKVKLVAGMSSWRGLKRRGSSM